MANLIPVALLRRQRVPNTTPNKYARIEHGVGPARSAAILLCNVADGSRAEIRRCLRKVCFTPVEPTPSKQTFGVGVSMSAKCRRWRTMTVCNV